MNRAKTPSDRADAALRRQSKVIAHDAAPVHAWLKSVLEGSLASRHAYAVKNRLKPFNEIVAKVQAKRSHEDPALRRLEYGPSNLTDVSGFRIVSLFNTEIAVALGHLLDLLETPTTSDPRGAFLAHPVEEIILFVSRRDGDPLSIEPGVKRIVHEHGLGNKLKIEPSTYSSVHVIVRSRFTVAGDAPLIAASEIQLRSVFEEAWSEISHRLKYAPSKRARARGRSSALPKSDESTFLLHLDALKSLTDGCAQYADLVNLELVARQASRDTRLPQPTDSAEELVRSFRTSDPAIHHMVERAFALRAQAAAAAREASENPDVDPRNHKRLFLETGQMFAEALERVTADTADAAHRSAHENVLLREVAFCHQFSGNAELRARAETIYEDLIKADTNNIDVLARLALIKRDEQDLSEARILMEDALREDIEQHPSERPSQIRWMLCRNLSVLYWQIFEDDRDSPDAADLLAEAVELSEQARNAAPTDRQRVGMSLYVLYYLAAQLARTENEARAAIVHRAESLLPLDLGAEVPLERWQPAKLDTLLHVEATFGTRERAKEIATMIVERLKATFRTEPRSTASERLEALSAEDQEYYLFAMEVLVSG